MKISSVTADQNNSSDEMRLPALDSESRCNLLNSFPAFLLNLDSEDSKLIPDGEFDFDWFQSSFPSPSFRSGLLTGFVATEDGDRDGPLFWPLENEIEWKSMKDWDWFTVSPRKMDLNSTGLRFHGRKIALNQASKRRLVFNSRSAESEMMELKQRRGTKGIVPRIGAVPSRFNRGTRNSAGRGCGVKLIAVDRDFVEKDLAAREEIPMEMLLGLREFDGREGFGSEFDDVVLALDEDETCDQSACHGINYKVS